MSDYVIHLVQSDLDQPTMEEWLARAAQLPRHDHLSETPAQALAAARSEAGLE
jgi:hypothetical protein